MRPVLTAILAAALSLEIGCTAGKAFIAPASEYEIYRRMRTAPSFEERMRATGRYLREYPNGTYEAEAKRYFTRAEPIFFKRSFTTEAGLALYLDILPSGPHAKDVSDKLARLQDEAGRADALLVQATVTEARLRSASEMRRRVKDEVDIWLEASLVEGFFTKPLGDQPASFLVPFMLRVPSPDCETLEGEATRGGARRLCRKLISQTYVVPSAGVFEEREIIFELTVMLADGDVPLSYEMAGPALFDRIDETYAKAIRVAEDANDRIASIERAVDVVSGAFERRVSPDPSCASRVVAPQVLSLSCRDVRLDVFAGGDETDDRIRISRIE